jgi:hydrogenase maturation protein HypF
MSHFSMCPDCQREYEDPTDRRFHAQPDACPVCGPKVWLEGRHGRMETPDPIAEARKLLAQGNILAIKSLGGFHLACNALNVKTVQELRQRKQRPAKPFAIMVPTLSDVEMFCSVSDEERELLTSVSRPIVLLRKKEEAKEQLEAVAPGIPSLGVMLSYTPLHQLLFAGPKRFNALVMTSGNRQDEPICRTNEEAQISLSNIADCFLFHDREIHNRCDDSIARLSTGAVQIFRRARGYVPNPVPLSLSGPCVLATGPELKNTFCLTRRDEAYLSQYIGDLNDQTTLGFYQEALERMKRVLDVKPEVAAYDLHPDYLATRFAQSLPGLRKIGVQHHHAHIASVLAEHNLAGPAIGVSFDGTGYGTDGQIWGGEFLKVERGSFERLGYLAYVPMPGGEAAIEEPWRMAVSYLKSAGYGFEECRELLSDIPGEELRVAFRLIETGFNSPLTSSAGRLFDAVAALLGFHGRATYEGQAACEMEGFVRKPAADSYPFSISDGKPFRVELEGMIRGVVGDLKTGTDKSLIAERFHRTLCQAISEACRRIVREHGVGVIALSGGVFQNKVLLESVWTELEHQGLQPLTNRAVPVNDGGIALGQAWIALQQRV